MLDNVIEQLTARSVLHDQVELARCLNDLVELDDVGVPDELQDVDLSGHPLNIGHICDPLLLQDLDRNLLIRQSMGAKLDLAKRAFAYGLANEVVANDPPLH